MAGVNKVILVGNLGKDPEVRHLEGGAVVAKFPLATSETYKTKEGQRVDQTEWHNVVMWRGLAESAEKYLHKGSLVYIEGKIRTRSWEDKEGNKRDLHVDDALDALDFEVKDSYRTKYENSEDVNLVTCPYFVTNRIKVTDELIRDYSNNDSFVILMNLGAELTLKVDGIDYRISKGQTFLIPSVFDSIELTGVQGELLEITVNHG